MGICRKCGSQDLYQVGNMFFHSFDKFAFKWNRRPICLAYSADNQLFCFGHIDEAPMALMSGLDLRPRHYLVWPAGLSLEFSHAAPFQQSRGVASSSRSHIGRQWISFIPTLRTTPTVDLLIIPLCMSLDVGGSRGTWRESAETQG